MVQAHGDVADDQYLQRATQRWQALRLGNEVVLEALSAKPFAFLEDNGANSVLPLLSSSPLHDHVELITSHAHGRRLRSAADGVNCHGLDTPTPSRASNTATVSTEHQHGHVRREWMVCKFWLVPLALGANHGFTRREVNVIRSYIERYLPRLLEAWDEHCRS
jgi:hypothetical protein